MEINGNDSFCIFFKIWKETIDSLLKLTNESIKTNPPNLDLTKLEMASRKQRECLNWVEKSGVPGYLPENSKRARFGLHNL